MAVSLEMRWRRKDSRKVHKFYICTGDGHGRVYLARLIAQIGNQILLYLTSL